MDLFTQFLRKHGIVTNRKRISELPYAGIHRRLGMSEAGEHGAWRIKFTRHGLDESGRSLEFRTYIGGDARRSKMPDSALLFFLMWNLLDVEDSYEQFLARFAARLATEQGLDISNELNAVRFLYEYLKDEQQQFRRFLGEAHEEAVSIWSIIAQSITQEE